MRPLAPAALPAPDHAQRTTALRARLDELEVGGMLVTHPHNVRYLTGFTGSNGQVLVLPDRTMLITDDRYEGRAATEAPGAELVLDRDWADATRHLADDAGLGHLAFEAHHLAYAEATTFLAALGSRIEGVAVQDVVEGLRVTKDDHELAALTAAGAITDAAFEAVLGAVRPGLTELALARLLERTMEDLRAEGPAFPSIVAGGPNSAIPHHQPTDRELRAGELLKLDFGARYAGYHADMTRTVSLGEPGDAELADVHGLVRAAQQAGVDAATPDREVAEVDDACRGPLTAAGYGDRFVHGTGHGVGLAIHEAPWVSQGASGRLAAGTVVTVEPGVYLPGRGGVRIEDTVVVTADGSPTRLTTSPRDLLRL
jgi:Xaa-Pro aminopeptidase